MSRAKERIILGIDPGTIVLGYGLLCVSRNMPRMVAMGVVALDRMENHYQRLGHIYRRIVSVIDEFLPDEVALEAPFYGKNIQSMLKLGRAQGVAMAAALSRDIPITEYSPTKVKQSITGTGQASKEQVAAMLRNTLKIKKEDMQLHPLDATDALAVALCHYYQSSNPLSTSDRSLSSWKAFVNANPDKIKGG
ncbi:MAG: crossover junction endodeoxyribonuclease RuvC [Porphyromonas sp.]|nr:crossover junction endodeoxyribonuclease RuvC [Porphyromonas sp.]